MSKLLDLMSERPLRYSAELRAAGVHPRDLLAAADEGLVYRTYGMVMTPDVFADPILDDAIVCDRTDGVIGHLTAAARYGLCDAVPAQMEVIVPRSISKPPADLPVRILRTRDPDNLSVGVDISDFHGLPVRITNPARTLVDMYRLDPAAVRQHSVAAIARWVIDDRPTDDLYAIASHFGVWDRIAPQLEALIEARTGGMRP